MNKDLNDFMENLTPTKKEYTLNTNFFKEYSEFKEILDSKYQYYIHQPNKWKSYLEDLLIELDSNIDSHLFLVKKQTNDLYIYITAIIYIICVLFSSFYSSLVMGFLISFNLLYYKFIEYQELKELKDYELKRFYVLHLLKNIENE